MKLADMTFDAYLQALSSAAPVPGGGSASALCGAQGAALVLMVANLTLARDKYAAFHPLCQTTAAACAPLLDALLQQADADAAAYEAVMAAYRIPREPDPDARLSQIDRCLRHAALVPLQTMRISRDVLNLGRQLFGRSNPNCQSDLIVAAHCLTACARGAWENVAVNLDSLAEDDDTRALRNEGARIMREMDEAAGGCRRADEG